jgi:hypothetical protein
MTHINSISSGLFTDLSVARPSTPPTFSTLVDQATYAALFATEIQSAPAGTPAANTFVRIKNVREFPQVGTPPNIVQVPTYGSKTSLQIQGQSDAPQFEVTLNFVPNDWSSASLLGPMVGDGLQYAFRFAIMNSEPTASTATKYASTAGGIGTVQNSHYYFTGKLEALVVSPQLTDANQATLTISVQSAFLGAFTV